jgi:peptide/nickel transport system substrate-binding protein
MYKMKNYVPKQVIELEANEDWVLGAPKIKNFIWTIIPDRATQLLGLEKGDIDYVNFGGNREEVARLDATPHLFYVQANEPRTDVFGLNNSRLDKTTRQAMAYAVDGDAILEALGGPTVARIQDYFFMNEWIADGAVKWSDVYKYDPAKAKELLAQANYDPSREIVFITKGDKNPPPDAILMQEMLQDVGMTVGVKLVDTVSPYLYDSLDYDIANTGNVYDDPFIQAAVFACGATGKGGNSLTQYCNPEVDKLIAADALAKDTEERAALYRQMQEIMVNDAASIPKPYSPGRAVFNKRVKVPGPWAWYVWDNSWQWELES